MAKLILGNRLFSQGNTAVNYNQRKRESTEMAGEIIGENTEKEKRLLQVIS